MKIFILFICITASTYCQAQTVKEKTMGTFIAICVKAFCNMDSVAANSLIDKKTGFYIIHKSGVFTNYTKINVIDFYGDYPSSLIKQMESLEHIKVKKEALPVYNCEKEKWNKTGTFYNPNKKVKTLSELCKIRNKYEADNIPERIINNFINLEKQSAEIYIINKKVHGIFIITYINNKWVLTGINMAEGDCSA